MVEKENLPKTRTVVIDDRIITLLKEKCSVFVNTKTLDGINIHYKEK